eukprot:SAG11_NODE_1624_length_4555_cov_3.452424_1_plen_56_part_00
MLKRKTDDSQASEVAWHNMPIDVVVRILRDDAGSACSSLFAASWLIGRKFVTNLP